MSGAAGWIAAEWRLLVRSRLSVASLALLLALVTLAVASGIHEVRRQQQTIARLVPANEQDVAALAERGARRADPGNAAYYTFYATWDTPGDAAFLATGLRDAAPYALRVRALGLQAQLYEGETFNPELALAGRFDVAFVLIYLAPLFVIALLHDLLAGERQAGRMRLLLSLCDGRRLWRRRALLRYALLVLCVAAPVVAGALVTGMAPSTLVLVLAVIASYLAFWSGIALWVAARTRRPVAGATALMGAWLALTLIVPTVANAVLVRAIPVDQGVDLMLAQRQAVHGAWEIPRDETMRRFVASHPQWQDQAALPPGFQWKWYFAFHQVGDESVAGRARAYRDGLLARQAWSDRLGWLVPGVGAQGVLHRAACTDLPAQLAYQDRIAAFHERIRAFYYPYLFGGRPFGLADYALRPSFEPQPCATAPSPAGLGLLLATCWLVAAAGFTAPGRSRAA